MANGSNGRAHFQYNACALSICVTQEVCVERGCVVNVCVLLQRNTNANDLIMSRDSVVCTVTRLPAVQPINRGSIHGMGCDI
jgi:hypothetical protein